MEQVITETATIDLMCEADDLAAAVEIWLSEVEEDGYTREDQLSDLLGQGCISGMVVPLIYYHDTIRFFEAHREEIGRLLAAVTTDTGCSPSELFGDRWDEQDPLASEAYNQNLLAWFGFEETARTLHPDW